MLLEYIAWDMQWCVLSDLIACWCIGLLGVSHMSGSAWFVCKVCQ